MAQRFQTNIVRGVYGALIAASLIGYPASAAVLTSPSFQLESDVTNSFGGKAASTNYGLVSSGGEAVVGDGSSGSYKLASGYVPQIDASIQLHVQPAALVGYYSFDEPTGRVAYDSSVEANDALFVGSPTRQTGKIGGAIVTPATHYLRTSQEVFSMSTVTSCAWIYQTNAITARSTATARASDTMTNGMWRVGVGAASKPYAQITLGGTTYEIIADNAVGSNAWVQECMTYDGTVLSLYVNGAKAATDIAVNVALPSVTQPLSIGANSDGTATFNNPIDEVKVFARALAADEIKAEYDAQNVGMRSGVSLGAVTPGISRTRGVDISVATDAAGYNLAISQDHDLQSASETIPAVNNGGTVAAPAAWAEGVTRGLGFTLTGGPGLDEKWGSGSSYAALPGSNATFFSRSGYGQGSKDGIAMQYRLDVPPSQPAKNYQNTITYTATIIP